MFFKFTIGIASVLLAVSKIALADDDAIIRKQLADALFYAAHPKVELIVIQSEYGNFKTAPVIDMSHKSEYVADATLRYAGDGQIVIIEYQFGNAAHPGIVGKRIRLVGTINQNNLNWQCDADDAIIINNFPNECVSSQSIASPETLALANPKPSIIRQQILEAMELVEPYTYATLVGEYSPTNTPTGRYVYECRKMVEEPGVKIVFDCQFSQQASPEIAGKHLHITAVVEELDNLKGWMDIKYYCNSNIPIIVNNYPDECLL